MEYRFLKQKDPLLDQVMVLGRKNSSTLGFMPKDAFLYHGKQGWILAAHEETQLVAYCLFRLTPSKHRISITHLCVDVKFRNQGIAKQLLDRLVEKYRSLFRGISLSCREDYEIAIKFYENYGFDKKLKSRSRSQEEKYLFKMWFDFGTEDLFSSVQSSHLEVVIDVNIIIKLSDNPTGESTVKSLLSDWLVDEVDYFYTRETKNEIQRDKDQNRALRTIKFLQNFKEISCNSKAYEEHLPELLTILTAKSINATSDRKQLAECKASGKEYFITEDEDIIKRRDQIYDTLKISVMNPVEFILEIDELRNSQLYEPARFGGARHEIRKVDSENLQSIIAQFLHLDSGITRNNFRNLIKITVSDAKHSNVKIISSPENSAIGIFGYTKSSDSLEVKFIRAKTTVLSNTLITQILFELIKESVELEINRLVISNAIIENRQEVISILEDLGFFSDGENWIKLSFKGCISFSEFFDSHQDLYKFSVILKIYNSILSIQNGGSRDALLFQLEKMLWPQKFLI